MEESVYFEDLDTGPAWVVEPSGWATAIPLRAEPLELSREDMELLAPGVLEEARRCGLVPAE